MKVIDTRRNTKAGGALSHLSNRIYICEPCAREMGAAMGQVSPEVYDRAVEALHESGQREATLETALANALTQQHQVVDTTVLFAKLDELTKVPSNTASAARKPAAAKK
jgi:hypothetical protein